MGDVYILIALHSEATNPIVQLFPLHMSQPPPGWQGQPALPDLGKPRARHCSKCSVFSCLIQPSQPRFTSPHRYQ